MKKLKKRVWLSLVCTAEMKKGVYTPCFSQLHRAVVSYRKYENTAWYEKISEYYLLHHKKQKAEI